MKKRITAILLATALFVGAVVLTGCAKNENEENGFVFELNEDAASYSVVEYKGNAETLNIPSIFKGLPVTEIKNAAVYGNTRLKKLIISENIKTIGLSAFRDSTYLEEIVFPASLEEIKLEAFSGCISLKKITVNEGNKVYSSKDGVLFAANESELVLYPARLEPTAADGEPKIYTVPQSVTKIRKGAFRDCKRVDKVVLPEGLIEIESYAFYNFTTLTGIDLKNVQTIGEYAFYNCTMLDEIVIPDSVQTVGEYAFANCMLASRIIIGKGLTEIAPYTFSSCKSANTINTGGNITKISRGAFNSCASAVRVLFPITLELIEEKAFSGCEQLDFIYYKGTQEQYVEIKVEKNNPALQNKDLTFEYEGG